MKKPVLTLLIFGIVTLFSITLVAQGNFKFLQVTHPAITNYAQKGPHWFGIIELPFMLLSVFLAFAAAQRLKHGVYGKGAKLLTWGFTVMTTCHFHMQVENFVGLNIVGKMLGDTAAVIFWSIALFLTWGLFSLGIYHVYIASGLDANNQGPRPNDRRNSKG
ncbi:MAG TPA: hypothetical protein VEV87_02955, partial [Chitinophagaceae bacterium]|nr:hypothetical protein [Chitinophagaceae bacterium]